MYRVYVLQNPAGKRYIGLSDDPVRRLGEHNDGRSRWTKPHRPWMIAWTSEKLILSEARKLENLLKRQKGGNGFSQLTGLPPSGS